ncbi:MAG TPA: glycosyltransferase family 9 protein [Bryobacteraceae bacterium]
MENTCSELLECCLQGKKWPDDLLARALAIDEGRAVLSTVVERLGDLFEPKLCETYRALFTDAIARVYPALISRIRQAGVAGGAVDRFVSTAERVYVLSRITLGADIAVTSVLLDAAKRRFPGADIVFVGPRKNYELFAADPRIRHLETPYARGGRLIDRLRASAELWFDDGLVVDPDSRLTQLGLIAVCPENNYLFFESRSFGGAGAERLPNLAARWARETFGIDGARPYIAPLPVSEPRADITVSLGVGENPAKRIGGDFERELLCELARTGASVSIDKGGSEEERRRVENVLQPGMRAHEGPFAPFAAQIARSRLFVGYDSAAGHVASACGIPQIAIMHGFANERMFARWRPNGMIVRGDQPGALEIVAGAIRSVSLS